ncbi:hypothetical protein IAE30_28235 [Pantoea sp. S61]|uniref:hypothetical protein n=1 Tax=Pantoea sp. S61 TaxID=2767442 RepID=UPI001909EDA6|nr:hypothetical protein [Pantoea sp. S61]MBK0127633.1 hypothetical protein [Pantoea sp. S61]
MSLRLAITGPEIKNECPGYLFTGSIGRQRVQNWASSASHFKAHNQIATFYLFTDLFNALKHSNRHSFGANKIQSLTLSDKTQRMAV